MRLFRAMNSRFVCFLVASVCSWASIARAQCQHGDVNSDGEIDALDLEQYGQWLLGPFVLFDRNDPRLVADFPLREPVVDDGQLVLDEFLAVSIQDMLALQLGSSGGQAGPTSPPYPCEVEVDNNGNPIARRRHIGWGVGDTTLNRQRVKSLSFRMTNKSPLLCTSDTVKTAAALFGGFHSHFEWQQHPAAAMIPDSAFSQSAFWVQCGILRGARNYGTIIGGTVPNDLVYYFEASARPPNDTVQQIAENYHIEFGQVVSINSNSASGDVLHRSIDTPPRTRVQVTIEPGNVWSRETTLARFQAFDAELRWNHVRFTAEIHNKKDEIPGMIQTCVPIAAIDLMTWTDLAVEHDNDVAFAPLLPLSYGNIHHELNTSVTRWMQAASDGGANTGPAVSIGRYPSRP